MLKTTLKTFLERYRFADTEDDKDAVLNELDEVLKASYLGLVLRPGDLCYAIHNNRIARATVISAHLKLTKKDKLVTHYTILLDLPKKFPSDLQVNLTDRDAHSVWPTVEALVAESKPTQ